MATVSDKTTLAPDVSSRLARLRWIIRGYVWLQGLAILAACLALAFWVSLAIDWIFEPSVTGRAVILILIAVAVFLVVRFPERRKFVQCRLLMNWSRIDAAYIAAQ